MIKHALTALTLAFAPLSAQAGDPCPIEINMVDLGAPSWLNINDLLAAQGNVQPWVGFRSSQVGNGRAISFVYPNSPMARAGVTPGGVITTINGTAITDETTYFEIVDAISPEDVLRLTILQEGGTRRYDVTVGAVDPISFGIANALDSRDCSEGTLTFTSPADRTALHPHFYDANRRFRCDDAHEALEGALPPYTTSNAYVLRGSRRIIIAMPPWGTTCVNVADISGDQLTTGNLLNLIDRVAADYIADRHANP